jgi:membrane protease YdiL (CAAX protease family)
MTIAKEQPSRQGILRPPSAMVRKVLLVCGILAPLLYVAADILAAILYEGYNYTDQTISELFAVGAPTRPLVLVLAPAYALLVYAFGAGLWISAGGKRALRFVAAGLIGKEVLGLVVTLFFPMHMRGVEGTLTDAMHATLTLVGNLFFLLAIGFGATAFGKRFRLYSIATMVLIVVGGVLAGLDAPQMAADLPTPWMGLWERMDAFAYVLWMAVLAIALLRTRVERPKDGLGGRGHPMKTIKAFVKRHPLLSYFALTFAISWGGVLMVVVPSGIPATKEQTEMLLPFVYLAMLAGPSVAGILLTGFLYGRMGLRELLSRLFRWQVGARWYAIALLTAPLLATATLLALSLTSPEFLTGIFTSDEKATLLLVGIAVGLGVGIFEELGWTGFAVATLLRLRYGVLSTGLIVGLLWGAWHFLLYFWLSGNSSGALSLPLLLASVLFSVGVLLAYRVLMVWVYDRTGGSLLVAILMHAGVTGGVAMILMPLAISVVPLVSWYLVLTAALWVVVGAVAVVGGGHLSRQPPRRRVA